ncbi:hypothetical protein [Baekduia sp. Peel2402]|uniref:hypothetical protein n=1 Tax=Baekduia sp. Peel2402 TaxID=3458296 RepID=UPI00403EA636
MPTIEIWDTPYEVELADLLDLIGLTEDLRWTILEMWATASDEDADISHLEEAEHLPTGLVMTGAELRALAGELLQVIDGIVVGYLDHPPDRTVADLRDVAEVVIKAIDSTYWLVHTRDAAVVDRVRRAYEDVREVGPETPIAPDLEAR